MFLGLVSKKDFLGKLSILLGANGVDFAGIIAKTRDEGVKKAEEALLIEQEAGNSRTMALGQYVDAKAKAQEAFDKAIALANNDLDDQMKQVDWQMNTAQTARTEANKLLSAATYFSS